MEDEEYKKLPIEERCVHKLWKARVNGYEEVTKLFKQIDDEKSPEFGKYLGLVKKFVVDSNALGQEKGLEATLAYIENYAHAGKTVSEVMSGIVSKCVAAPKTKTRELAQQVTLMYIEIEKQDAVLEELIKGMDQKNPKIVTACVLASTTALKEFGIKIINPKPLVKKLSVLFADRDKAVRDEARQLAIEMFRWMGAALKPQLTSLQAVQLSELETEFAKIENKAQPTRYVKSQQQKQAKIVKEADDNAIECDEEEEVEDAPPINTYDLADPVDILSKLPKDFYDKLEAKKWQERKEALEQLEVLLNTPKLENGDYGDLVRALKKVIQKDSNVVCVAFATKCLASLASGLKRRFQTYAGAVFPALLEKFKEKKAAVVTSNREAIDAVYLTTSLESVLEDVLEALNNKNPTVKSETAMFLARSFTKTQPTALNKKLLKSITGGLEKTVNESDPTVRDSACEALGTLMKLVGEKAIAPFLGELEKENLKMAKIKECYEKAVIVVKVTAPKKERAAPAKTKAQESKSEAPKSVPTSKVVKKPSPGAGVLKKKSPISSGTATIVKSKSAKGLTSKSSKPVERELSDEEVDSAVADKISSNICDDISNANWKTRLAAVEQLQMEIQTHDAKDLPCQALVKFLARKPGLKDTNFQVLKAKFDLVRYLAENCSFSVTSADCCLGDLAEKFGDPKNGTSAGNALTAIAEAAGFSHVANFVVEFAVSQKSPKITSEGLLWLSNAILEFGFGNLNAKGLLEHSKKALASANQAVRQAAITLLGTVYLYVGPSLITCFDSEKASLREQIQAEFDKHDGEQAPVPTRGVSKSESVGSLDNLDTEEIEEVPTITAQDLLPRIDISPQITESLVAEMSDKNWKVRNEALTKLSNIIQEAKLIKPNIGNLPQALAERLSDSNTKIAQTSMNLCEAIAKAMGPPVKQYVRTLFPGFLQGLGDNKAWMRTAALDAINSFADQGCSKEFFEGEMIGDALKSGSPVLRSELWAWLAEKVPKIPVKSIPKEELMICMPYLYNNLEDRNADVRKNAQEATLGFMIHTSYEAMVKQTEKLKPGSKNVIMGLLDKVRPNLPVKPLPKNPTPDKESKSVRGTKPVTNAKNAVKPKSASVARQSTVPSRKKDDDVDTSPLLVVNNMKHQRTIDESKLKVLKWNFTTPREEFVDLLKEQMNNANVNKTLIANMFHSDFRYHLKAIESLTDDLNENSAALISNLDLILKWLTLRFFDTNPSVLLKGLDYLNLVFEMLIEMHYRMPENEASSFIPYLILKIGDPKDAVRNGVKSLFRQISYIYPVSRLFTCIMEGVKSKNARQRAECLEVMGTMIETDGIIVCMPSPAVCLKEVAKQISDRDNSVRNAALNCVVQAYLIVGEKVFKMVGNLSDKEFSMLEERIKRAKRNPVKSPVKTETSPQMQSPQKDIRQNSIQYSPNNNTYNNDCYSNEDEPEDEEEDDELNLPPVTLPQLKPREVEGPFKLDAEFMKELDKINVAVPRCELVEFDLDFLKEDIKAPGIAAKSSNIMPISPPKPISNDSTLTNLSRPKEDDMLNRMSSSDMPTALEAIDQMQKFLNSNRSISMIDREDEFMMAVSKQLGYLSEREFETSPYVLKTYRNVLSVIDQFYLNKILGRHISINVLKDIIQALTMLLVQGKLDKCADGDTYIRVINLNCCKLIERSDHTRIFCALIQLSQDCLRSESSPRQTELVMKCLWRVIKLMPQWGADIQYDQVLADILNFFREFPPAWWKTKPSDTLFRTIKTVVHSSVKIRGSSILNDLAKVPNYKNTEVDVYIQRQLKTLKIDDSRSHESQQDTPQSIKSESSPTRRSNLSKSSQNQLTAIFQKIGNKEETKEGLNLLYDFIQQHPEADIEPFLRKCSTFFQDYIKNGLRDIKEFRESSRNTIASKVVEKVQASILTPELPEGVEEKGPDYWKDRLQTWKKVYEEVTQLDD